MKNPITHIREHKKEYAIGAAGVVGGGAAMLVFGPQVVNIVDVGNLKFWSPTHNTVITQLARRSCMEPVMVRCVETGEVFGSIRRASELLDVNAAKISEHLRGVRPDVKGMTFEKVAG